MLSQQDLAEEARIQALHALDLLGTPPEDRFDRFTRLAAAAFRVPIALVSLVDRERRCDMLVVPDTLQDVRFRDHPRVTGAPGIRFYAGQPLHSVDGQPLGTLCILDTAPRAFGDADRRLLCDLARLVEDELRDKNAGAAELAALRARLAESSEWLRTIADNVPALIAYVDTGLRYRFANGFGLGGRALAAQTLEKPLAQIAVSRTPTWRALTGERAKPC